MGKTRIVLLTNDDGIDAEGIRALEAAFLDMADVDVWTVAPDRERSTCSNAMTLARPVFARNLGDRRVAVDGLPVDCVYLAVVHLMETPPDVVVSGINRGPNLGSDVIFSGTVAGARQAALQGIHGVAASLIEGDDFEKAAEVTVKIALDLASKPASPPRLVNLNFPGGSFSGPRLGRLGSRNYPRLVTERIAPLTKDNYYWLGGPPVKDGLIKGTDGWLVNQGIASATLLRLDQTDEASMSEPGVLLPEIEPV
jgi:5'-nucleotidase